MNKAEIRKISGKFIERKVESKYYHIYKSTFSSDDWYAEMKKLIKRYQGGNKWFDSNVADVFAAESFNNIHRGCALRRNNNEIS